MKSCIAALTCSLIVTNIAAAQPDAPQEPPPAFKIVSSTDKAKGLIMFLETRNELVPEVRTITVIENGVQVTRNVTNFVTKTVTFTRAINAAESRIITPDGKKVPIDDVWKRVKAKTVVVVSGNSEAPAQAYLRALSADTVIIIPAADSKK